MKSDDEYVDFLIRCAKHFGNSPETQIIRVMEEGGEVAQAWIGFIGANPRKGVTHRAVDVADELADLAMTALLGIVMLGFDPFDAMTKQQEKAEGRLRDASAHVSG